MLREVFSIDHCGQGPWGHFLLGVPRGLAERSGGERGHGEKWANCTGTLRPTGAVHRMMSCLWDSGLDGGDGVEGGSVLWTY